jgi:hypothetical protein
VPAFDFKKEFKDLYFPKATPSIIDVPEMVFIMVDGQGDPNTSEAYINGLEILYGLSYSIKMSKKGETVPEGYFDYVVPPLEGLWSLADDTFKGGVIADKNKLIWTSMIRQPEFVTPEVFETAKKVLAKKKPNLDTTPARLEKYTEGLCGQVMHIGPYDDEPQTVAKLQQFITESGYREDMSAGRRHHEIYLSDPRKTAPEKMKTVIRHPITKL